jgi:Skp family chaperone for outer membrane proteins
MKYYKYFQLFALLLSILSASFANCAPQFDAKIAIVDVQLILEHSDAVQNIRKSIDLINDNLQQDITIREKELKKYEDELLQKRDHISTDAFDKEVQEFDKKVGEAQKDMKKKKTHLEQVHSEAIGRVHKVTMEIISDLAKKYHFHLVLPSSQVLFANDDLNITQEVIILLNKKLKTVDVNYK